MFTSSWRTLVVAVTVALSWYSDAQAQTKLYISGTMHIENNPDTWPADPDAFVDFFRHATRAGYTADRGHGMRWSVGADIDWLTGEEPIVVHYIITETSKLGVEWDIHAHDPLDRQDCYDTLDAIAAWFEPTLVCSGLQASEISTLRIQAERTLLDPAYFSLPVLWGIGHDDQSFGCYRPESSANWSAHDDSSPLIHVGGGTRTLDGIANFAYDLEASIAIGAGPTYPVTSATINVRPETLQVVGTEVEGDRTALDILKVWAREMAQLECVEWGTIRETADAWAAAGGINSRVE